MSCNLTIVSNDDDTEITVYNSTNLTISSLYIAALDTSDNTLEDVSGELLTTEFLNNTYRTIDTSDTSLVNYYLVYEYFGGEAYVLITSDTKTYYLY